MVSKICSNLARKLVVVLKADTMVTLRSTQWCIMADLCGGGKWITPISGEAWKSPLILGLQKWYLICAHCILNMIAKWGIERFVKDLFQNVSSLV